MWGSPPRRSTAGRGGDSVNPRTQAERDLEMRRFKRGRQIVAREMHDMGFSREMIAEEMGAKSAEQPRKWIEWTPPLKGDRKERVRRAILENIGKPPAPPPDPETEIRKRYLDGWLISDLEEEFRIGPSRIIELTEDLR